MQYKEAYTGPIANNQNQLSSFGQVVNNDDSVNIDGS